MDYMDGKLEAMDNYFNYRNHVKLPHDSYMKDSKKLAKLSGECKTIVKGVSHDDSMAVSK